MTRDKAVALIERMKTIRPTCERCYRASYAEVEDAAKVMGHPKYGDELRRNGWEDDPHRAGLFHRCKECAAARSYPWADKLDPDRVVAYASTTVEPFLVAELEQTL